MKIPVRRLSPITWLLVAVALAIVAGILIGTCEAIPMSNEEIRQKVKSALAREPADRKAPIRRA